MLQCYITSSQSGSILSVKLNISSIAHWQLDCYWELKKTSGKGNFYGNSSITSFLIIDVGKVVLGYEKLVILNSGYMMPFIFVFENIAYGKLSWTRQHCLVSPVNVAKYHETPGSIIVSIAGSGGVVAIIIISFIQRLVAPHNHSYNYYY